jgi:hypothetical protein
MLAGMSAIQAASIFAFFALICLGGPPSACADIVYLIVTQIKVRPKKRLGKRVNEEMQGMDVRRPEHLMTVSALDQQQRDAVYRAGANGNGMSRLVRLLVDRVNAGKSFVSRDAQSFSRWDICNGMWGSSSVKRPPEYTRSNFETLQRAREQSMSQYDRDVLFLLDVFYSSCGWCPNSPSLIYVLLFVEAMQRSGEDDAPEGVEIDQIMASFPTSVHTCLFEVNRCHVTSLKTP